MTPQTTPQPLTKESFLARKTAVKPTTLPDGTPAFIRKLSAAEVEHVRKNYQSDAKALEGYRYLVTRGLVDEQGVRLFGDGASDMAALAAVEYDDVETIAVEIMDFAGLMKARDPKKS